MADSPLKNADGVLSCSVSANGSPLPDTVRIVSIRVYQVINKIPRAQLSFVDGDMPNQDFPLSNEAYFKPGSEISIKVGFGDQQEEIFSGIVIQHGISIENNNTALLNVECKDKALAMVLGRKNVNYSDVKDSDVIATVVANYGGLSVDVESTSVQYNELVQYYSSDWDFVLTRAEINGFLVCISAGKLTIKPPDVSQSAQLAVTYGEDLIEFQANVDALNQLKEVTSVTWDMGQQAIAQETASSESLNNQGNLGNEDLAKVLGLSSYRLQTTVPLESGALQNWAKGQQIKAGLSKIRGRMRFAGSALAKMGTLIQLKGVGDRFNGNVFVSGVEHIIANNNWQTVVDFGMPADWSADRRDLAAPPASGLLPGVEGLQIGVVMKLDGDPKNENRIQVKVPILQAQTEGVWARLAHYYASKECGHFFIPEVDDEVVLGYFNNDPSNPVVLGSLYSSQRSPAYQLTADNFTKAVVTKSKLKIEYDDDKKVITIITPSNNQIVLSDDAKSILIQDMNNNKVELSDSGIVVDSPKDISLTAQGKITLKATGEISMTSQADVKVSGLNINQTAQVQMVAKGSASAEFSASGTTTIKGAMVMIN